MATSYKKAIVKFNNGRGALLCNGCRIILKDGLNHPDKEHYCDECSSTKKLFQKYGTF